MIIATRAEYEAALARAQALGAAAAQEDTPEGRELAALTQAIRRWEDERGDRSFGREANPEPGTNRSPDDLPVAGLPGNLGKLRDG
jgi:hypothetical protein